MSKETSDHVYFSTLFFRGISVLTFGAPINTVPEITVNAPNPFVAYDMTFDDTIFEDSSELKRLEKSGQKVFTV